MNKIENTSGFIDELLRFLVSGGAIATILVAPNTAKLIGDPLHKYLNKLDRRHREREIKRVLYYMRQRGLIALTSEQYEHGMVITNKGNTRLRQREFDTLTINTTRKWDGRWRLVFFDIPEDKRAGRRQLIYKLKQLNFVQLQRSVWIHPFPCRDEIEIVTSTYQVQKYVSYVEATGIDSEKVLKQRFKTIL